jgi:hypothetical protein
MSQPVVPPQANLEQTIVQEVSLPIYQSKGWMKLIGILSIIGGVLYALSIVGIIVAWIPIWMGVVLYKAASAIETAHQSGNKYALNESLGNIKTYFTIMGILTLISIIFFVGMMCVMIIVAITGAASFNDFYNGF